MIEVVVLFPDGRSDRAEAETPEDALFAARTLYDESRRGVRGEKRTVSFLVAGKVVRTVEGRP